MKIQTKIVECSLGFKTSEPMAKRIDELLASLPSERRRLVKKSSTKTELDEQPRTDVSTITTTNADRDREIVLADGIELEEFRANPIVLFGHNQTMPCGKCLWVKPSENGLLAKTLYPEPPANFQGEWLPSFVFGLVAAEVLRGKSIGFVVLEEREPNEEEKAKFPEVENVVTKSLLCEYSVVSVPSNPQALVQAINKGLTKLEHWGFEVIGKSKRKSKQPVAKKAQVLRLPELELNPEEIAQEVIADLLKQWEA